MKITSAALFREQAEMGLPVSVKNNSTRRPRKPAFGMVWNLPFCWRNKSSVRRLRSKRASDRSAPLRTHKRKTPLALGPSNADDHEKRRCW